MKNDTTLRMLRRTFLAGTGATALGSLMRPITANAAAGTAPQRLLVIHRPCGTRLERWFPTQGGVKDWTMTDLLSSFSKVRNKMVVMKGVDAPRIQDWLGDKHGAGMISMISPPPKDIGPESWPLIPGLPRGDTNEKNFTSTDSSVDQELLANVAAFQGTRIKSLQLGASLQSMMGTGQHCLRVVSYSGSNQPLWPESRPTVAFSNIFATAMQGMDPATAARLQAQDKSVLDFIAGDLTALRARAPKSQYMKLDSHLTSIRQLEMNVASGGTAKVCANPTLDAAPNVAATDDDGRHAYASKAMMQIIKSTFQCDLTRVISFTFGWGNSDIHFAKVLPGGLADTEGHHNISHSADSDGQYAADKFYGDIVGGLVSDMDAIVEDNGNTMLDNTLVVYWNECSIGGDHHIQDMPVALFGGKTVGLQGGSFLQFKGRTMADFWVETFKRYGYNKTQYGAAMWNLGPLPGIYAP